MIAETERTLTKSLLADTTHVRLRPRYEGSNICTWIGFKHVNYLVEEAVLEHFRGAGLSARQLFEVHGLGVDIVDLDTRILHALHMDDLVTAEVVPVTKPGNAVIGFQVNLWVERAQEIKAVVSKVDISLRVDGAQPSGADVPTELSEFAVTKLGEARPASWPAGTGGSTENTSLSEGRGTTGGDAILERLTAGRNAFGWKWRIPYPYCHFSERLQMSGYLRQMEEVVDLFLADRGISIRRLLTDRRWIPVVPHSRIRVLDEVLMEEELYTIYTVEDVFKDLTYTARMDCYVLRAGQLVLTATGRITHGYAVIENRSDWRLVNFDADVMRALNAGSATR